MLAKSKSLLVAVGALVLANAAFAKSTYVGLTEEGAQCVLTMKLEENYMSFSAPKVSFIFPTRTEDIEEALVEGENPVIIRGGDKIIGAKLYLTFGLDGSLQDVIYRERALIFPKTVKCLGLVLTK